MSPSVKAWGATPLPRYPSLRRAPLPTGHGFGPRDNAGGLVCHRGRAAGAPKVFLLPGAVDHLPHGVAQRGDIGALGYDPGSAMIYGFRQTAEWSDDRRDAVGHCLVEYARKGIFPYGRDHQRVDFIEKRRWGDMAKELNAGCSCRACAQEAGVLRWAVPSDGERGAAGRQARQCVDQILQSLGGIDPAHRTKAPWTGTPGRRQGG